MKPNLQKQGGFSLLEVIITLLIIAVILSLYQAALGTVFVTRTAKDQETALLIANNKLEELRAGGYNNLPAGGSFNDAQLSLLPGGSASLTVTDYSSTTKQTLVNVQWLDPVGLKKSISITTLITKYGGL